MSTPSTLNLSTLTAAVAGNAVAIRAVTKLVPAGGSGDKVFPPTYVKEGRAETSYAMEIRKVDGREVTTVLLDSVASQANRIEEALLEGWRRGEFAIPVIAVDFTGEEDLEDLGQITSLQAPHRVADAILRDSLDSNGVPFRQTEVGRACTDARPNHATGMYRYCPTALLFGVWDSTGPRGGSGAKFQRVVVSEIVGYDAIPGVKTSSRIDPLGIEKKAGEIYELAGDQSDWTPFPEQAAQERGGPKLFSRKTNEKGKDKEKGKPSSINHGNVRPDIEYDAGGVTLSHAVHTVVMSLAGLRRLRFQTLADGSPVPPANRDAVETAARVALAALALSGIAAQRLNGYDLRSRSLLVPTEPLVFEVIPGDGGDPERVTIVDPPALLKEAIDAAAAVGVGWVTEPMNLRPTPKLAHLVRESRKLTVADGGDDEAL